jgi:hypothetical protein
MVFLSLSPQLQVLLLPYYLLEPSNERESDVFVLFADTELTVGADVAVVWVTYFKSSIQYLAYAAEWPWSWFFVIDIMEIWKYGVMCSVSV